MRLKELWEKPCILRQHMPKQRRSNHTYLYLNKKSPHAYVDLFLVRKFTDRLPVIQLVYNNCFGANESGMEKKDHISWQRGQGQI